MQGAVHGSVGIGGVRCIGFKSILPSCGGAGSSQMQIITHYVGGAGEGVGEEGR